MARTKKNKTSIGCLFWIALILLVLVVFLFNRETIQNVLDETGFIEILQKNKKPENPEVEQVETPEETAQETPENTTGTETETIIENPAAGQDEETVLTIEVEEQTSTPEETAQEIPEPDKKVRRSKLYFIQVADDGSISLRGIVRPVYFVDSPLTETMKTLLEGLSSSELNMGLISLIPEQTKLKSINLKDGVAFMNFSDSFRFNSFGKEGYNAQLKQIVYTATEFSNINSVQILIDGAKIDYMGPEGVYIGKPLTRSDF